MIPSSKLLWGEGLFLRPQHFQRQDAYHEWRLAEVASALHPYAWGTRHAKVDADALATGVLRFLELRLIFPDGELYSAPQEDELPAPVSLESIPAGTSELVFHATMAQMRASGSNFSGTAEPNSALRFSQHNLPAPDWFTGAAQSELSVLRRSVRILAEQEPRDHLTSLPVCRLKRSATGTFELDTGFVAPAVSIASAPALHTMLRRLLDILYAKVDALYGYHREPSRHVIEFRSGDIASFWLLHTASTAFASLSHFLNNPGLHPERLFERMLELAGSLMTFSRSVALSDLPIYRHASPGASFERLDQIIRELLETVISTKYFTIALDEVKPSFHHGRLDSELIGPATAFYIGVQAAVPPSEIVEIVPQRFKVGAPDDVEKLVLSAMSGVRLSHAPQVPAAIPVRPGAYYFAIEPRGPLYERMLASKTITLYAPAGIPDLRLELFALNQ
ncbi:MAG: type VI secretion system baseplate subunit TssK [Caldimonas sp.]